MGPRSNFTFVTPQAVAKGLLLALCLCGTILAQENPTGDNRPAQRSLPAAGSFAQWLEQQRRSGPRAFTDAQEIATGLKLAQARTLEMRTLLEQDPEQFVRRALPAAERAQLPAQLQPFVEQRIQGRGFFGVYCGGLPTNAMPGAANEHPPGGYGYEVRLGGVTYQAHVFGKWRDQTTVQEAAIQGVALGDALAVGDSPTPTEQTAGDEPVIASAPTTTGPNTLLYLIARFSDQTADPVTEANALSNMGVVSDFWINNSSGVVSLRGLVNSAQVMDIVHIVLPQPSSYAATYNNNFGQLLSDARTAASGQGYNYANYNLDLVVTTGSGFGYAGRAYISGQGAHVVSGYTSLRTAGHELGHNLGLYHADYWRTDSTRTFGKDSVPGGYAADTVNGEWIEYGHYFSLMSAQLGPEIDDATKPHYAAVEKVRLGWLSGNEVQYVTASGSYRLYRQDHGATRGTPRALRIETPATDYTGNGRRYWLNYRYAPWSTGQDWLRNGVQVDVCQSTYGRDGAIQLDMTPYSNDDPSGASYRNDNADKVDGALVVGRTYDDANAGIHLTPVATGNNGVNEEYIDVVINLGSLVGNRPPVISAFSAATNQVALNQAVSFNVVATDPDGDALAYSWDFDQVQTWTASGLNSAVATKSWPNAGQYRVTATVSDMKGGVSSESLIVTVGAPVNTSQVWGRVLWGGQPVYGARVWTSAGGTVYQAWSDSDGTYRLTDLAAASTYPVSCAAAELTFTAQSSNPVSVAGGNAYGADFYANERMAGGSGIYAVSGQVTDASVGVAGAEVRGGGMVVTTDAAGNFQFTNFVSGSYNLVARKDSWTFAPASRTVTVNSANATGNNFARAAPYSIAGRFSGIPAGAQSPAPTVYLSNGRAVQASPAGSGANRYWAYTLIGVPAGQYSVSAKLSGYRIVPSGFSNPLSLAGNLNAINFSGVAGTVAGAISGRITRAGTPLTGVAVQVQQGSVLVDSGFTDSDGYYRVENLASAAYTILPGLAGYSFSPASLTVSSVPASGQNFSASGGSAAPSISSITATPASVPSAAGRTTLATVAAGSGTLTYAWDALSAPAPVTFSVNDSSSAASTAVNFRSPGSYLFRVRVTGTDGLSATANVNVTVSGSLGAIMVVAPYEVQTSAGQTVAFRADAWDQMGNRVSVSPLWSVSGGGRMDSRGLFTAVTPGVPYFVTATAGSLSATGRAWVAGATGPIPPAITSQPVSLKVPLGGTAGFNVAAGGSEPLQYQWLFNGEPIPGATTSNYSRANVHRADSGNYSVQITNATGGVVSSNALLTVPMALTTGRLTSSVNPSLPAQPVIFTLTLGALAPSMGVPTGTVQFKVDGTDAGAPTALVGGMARYTNATLAHGRHAILAEYAGDPNFVGAANQLAAGQLINTLPVPRPNIIERDPTGGVKVSIATLLANDTDADGDPLTFLRVSPTSVRGGTVVSNSGWIFYTPLPGFTNVDEFSYRIGDGLGTPVTGVVTVTVRVGNGPAPNLVITRLSDGEYAIRGQGIPDRTYRIEFTDELQGMNWQTLGRATADELGRFQLTDVNGWPQRFYHSVYP